MSATTRREYRAQDGTKLLADVGGPPCAPAVVLLHVVVQTRHSWAGAMNRLLAQGYRVVNLDARGHGESDWSDRPGGYSLAARATDLQAVRSRRARRTCRR